MTPSQIMYRRLTGFAQRAYLGMLCAEEYPDQEPEHELARPIDLLWLLVPIVGFLIFLGTVQNRYAKMVSGERQ